MEVQNVTVKKRKINNFHVEELDITTVKSILRKKAQKL
jgi:hypothetical protein